MTKNFSLRRKRATCTNFFILIDWVISEVLTKSGFKFAKNEKRICLANVETTPNKTLELLFKDLWLIELHNYYKAAYNLEWKEMMLLTITKKWTGYLLPSSTEGT